MVDVNVIGTIPDLGPSEWHGTAHDLGHQVGRSQVVYALYDADQRCAYVGSSGHLRDRLRLHLRDKPLASWRAWEDRGSTNSANRYEREAALIELLEPYLNRWDMRSPAHARRLPAHLAGSGS